MDDLKFNYYDHPTEYRKCGNCIIIIRYVQSYYKFSYLIISDIKVSISNCKSNVSFCKINNNDQNLSIYNFINLFYD